MRLLIKNKSPTSSDIAHERESQGARMASPESTESSSAFGLRAYEATLEPYHAFIIKNTFRTGFRALPSRKEMLGTLAHITLTLTLARPQS